jgi:hypothetical protein
MKKFSASLDIFGINPFVFLPGKILEQIFKQAGKDKGPIPVRGSINGLSFQQTLVRYSGHWRLYVNTKMLRNSPGRIGELLDIVIEFDPVERVREMHPGLEKALKKNKEAKKAFERLAPSRQHEINRYIANLKSAESIDRNVLRAINFLTGKGTFVGRAKL